MSYQVFARKYRPQTFDEVVGQEHITRTLKNAIEQDRLAQAYLFVGPRGTGKTSTARILAKALNCVNAPTVSPCGECTMCREIAAGTSLNVLEFDAASNTQVDKIREIIIENVKYAPTSGRYKLYIVDEVHMLSTSSFNALLKTLEEPPPHVKFVFATTDVQKVPTTIVSRCQRFDLRRIPAPLISGHLLKIAANEKFQLTAAAANAIAKGAEGGLRDAESMLDQLVSFCGDQIDEDDVLKVFGFTAQETVSSLCDSIIDGQCPRALELVHEQAENGKDLSRLMADLISHLRNLIVAKADPEGIRAEVGEEFIGTLSAQAEKIALNRLLELIEQFAAAESRMRWAANKRLHFEIAIIKAIQTLGQASLDDVLDVLAAMRDCRPVEARASSKIAPAQAAVHKTEPAPVQRPAASSVAEKPATSATPLPSLKSAVQAAIHEMAAPLTTVISQVAEAVPATTAEPPAPLPALDAASLWRDTLIAVRKDRPLISAWVESGSLVAIEDGACVIAFPPDQKLALESVSRQNNRRFIEEIIARSAGRPLAVRFEIREGLVVEPLKLPELKPERPPDPMEAFKNDPLIRKALELFKAEIQPA